MSAALPGLVREAVGGPTPTEGVYAGVLRRLEVAWPEILAELAVQQPEPPAAGELPAEVEEILDLLSRAQSGWVREKAAELRALWPALRPVEGNGKR